MQVSNWFKNRRQRDKTGTSTSSKSTGSFLSVKLPQIPNITPIASSKLSPTSGTAVGFPTLQFEGYGESRHIKISSTGDNMRVERGVFGSGELV